MELELVKRASVKTDLLLGEVKAPVSLFKTASSTKGSRKWDTAGPNGGLLRHEIRGVDAEPEETPDALGVGSAPIVEDTAPAPEDPGPEAEAPPVEEGPDGGHYGGGGAPAADSAPGTVKRVLVEGAGEDEVVVEPEDVRRGIRLDDGEFVDLTDQLGKAEEESRAEGLEVLGFVRRERVPRERVVGSYYLAGDKKDSLRLVRVLFESMQESGRVGVVRWTKSKGQTLGILTPRGDGAMVVLELDFAEVWKAPSPKCLAHRQAEVKRSEIDAAKVLIEKMSWSAGKIEEIRNRRVELEDELVEKAETGKVEEIDVAPAPLEPEMAELATLLKRSAAA